MTGRLPACVVDVGTGWVFFRIYGVENGVNRKNRNENADLWLYVVMWCIDVSLFIHPIAHRVL